MRLAERGGDPAEPVDLEGPHLSTPLATVGASVSHLSFVDRHSGNVTVLHVDSDLVIPMAQLLSPKVWRIHDKTWRGESICNGSMDTRGESWVGFD